MKRTSIRELKGLKPTERFESVFLVQSKEVRHKRSGDSFLALRLADRTGALDAKMWDNVAGVADSFGVDGLVGVTGKVQVYNNQPQIVVHKLWPVADKDMRLADFVPHTDRDVNAMYVDLLAKIDSFENRHLRRLMRTIFREPGLARAFKHAPGAKRMHHARVGGLLEHVSSLLGLAEVVAAHYPDLDRDLLLSGVLLHDLGKVHELSGHRSFEYTDDGRLLGHIALGSAWLDQRCARVDGFPLRLKALLQHMILSHHGKLEFGSPVAPVFPEALALHYIDDLDSKLETMREARAEMADGAVWSQFRAQLGGYVLDRKAYLGKGSSVGQPTKSAGNAAHWRSRGGDGSRSTPASERPERHRHRRRTESQPPRTEPVSSAAPQTVTGPAIKLSPPPPLPASRTSGAPNPEASMSLLAGLEMEPTEPQEAAQAEASGMISPVSRASAAGPAAEPAASSVNSELAAAPPAVDAVQTDSDPESGTAAAESSEFGESAAADPTGPASAPAEPLDSEKPAADSATG